MFDMDFFIICICYLQPVIISYFIFNMTKNSVFLYSWFEQITFIKKKKKSVKFFECASYSRRFSVFQFDIHYIIFCVIFIVYDVDLVFFISESFFLVFWSYQDLFFFSIWFFFFVMGLWYDYEKYSFHWSY